MKGKDLGAFLRCITWMKDFKIQMNRGHYADLFELCIEKKTPDIAFKEFEKMCETGRETLFYSYTALVNFFMEHGCLDKAYRILQEISVKDWNIGELSHKDDLIDRFFEAGLLKEAKWLFKEVHRRWLERGWKIDCRGLSLKAALTYVLICTDEGEFLRNFNIITENSEMRDFLVKEFVNYGKNWDLEVDKENPRWGLFFREMTSLVDLRCGSPPLYR